MVTATDQQAAVEAGRASAESFRTIVDARLPSRFHCYFRFELKIGEFEPAHTKQALVRRPRMGDKLPTIKFVTARQFDADPLRNRAWDADHFYVLVVEEGLQTRLVKTKDGTWRIPLKGNLPYKIPDMKPPSPGDEFDLEKDALEGLREYLCAHYCV